MSWISVVPVAPLRAEPAHRSEMVSQLLFGESCDMLETGNDFVWVKAVYDGYTGWCQRSQLADAGDAYISDSSFVAAYTGEVLINGESCVVPHAAHIEPGELIAGGYTILSLVENAHRPVVDDDKAALIKAYAFRYLNTAYLWGGKSVFGVDCSGLVQQVFKMAGIWLPRDSADQAGQGHTVEFLQSARLGDLAFFDNDEGHITHAGIMLSNHEIIHASGYVHADPIDNAGIIHHITGARTHRLRIIKRLF